jgi:HlyD family secretion protein
MKKFLWRIFLLGIAAVVSFAAWLAWKVAHQSPVPEGIVFGNGRIESVLVDIAA